MEYRYKYENPFNVEAEWISHLRRLDESLFNDRDSRNALSPPLDLDAEVDLLFQKLPYIRDAKRLVQCGVPPEEKLIVQQWPHYNDFLYMLHFLSQYTLNLKCNRILSSAYFFSITHAESGQAKEFESLNSNVEETGLLILPKVQTINDPLTPAEENEDAVPAPAKLGLSSKGKHWATDRMPGIQGDLSNTYYVDKKELVYRGQFYRVMHSVLQRHIFPENKKSLKVAVCPVAHKDLLKVKTYCKKTESGVKKLCSVEGLKDEDFAYNRIQAAFLKAGVEHADILIFPEILGNETILSQDFFDEIQKKMSSLGYPMPSLILMPTWWHEYRNELYVLDSSGKCLCTQQKQKPYLLENKYEEDLRDPERIIHMVHIPGVGRFAFPICRDFLEDDYVQIMLQQLQATFLLCPSYSPNKTQFDLAAPGTIKYGCYTVWCNTCAAYHHKALPLDHIGLVAGPQNSPENTKLLSPECNGDCENKNTACVFIIDIHMDRSAIISCKHIIETMGA